MSTTQPTPAIDGSQAVIPTGEATGIIPVKNGEVAPITVIGTHAIRATFDARCIQQAINSRCAPGVTDLILNPDAHCGYGAPVGCVLVSPTHIYPGPVGVDIKCSMSLLQLDLPEDAIADKATRRALINAILERTPTGAGRGQRPRTQGPPVDATLGRKVVTQGAAPEVCAELGIPPDWARRCEDSFHTGHDGTADALRDRLDRTTAAPGTYDIFAGKMRQLGSYGGGNHFGECEIVRIQDNAKARATAEVFGLRDNHVAFLSHCGSRGWGAMLADGQFKSMQQHFADWGIPLPGGDRELVHAPLGTPEADAYIDDMALGANFATVNHLLINALVLEAFQEVIPGTKGTARLLHQPQHRPQGDREQPARLGAPQGCDARLPRGHHALKGTPFDDTGHPILLPGNPQDGSAVMVAEQGAALSCYSVNHGAGRRMSRTAATKTLDQKTVDESFDKADILFNGRNYPIDEAPRAYKDFKEVLSSVEKAGLASEVARLQARFVIKDGDKADD